jgi:O-antigen/teichoic acid export membrane protein
VQPFDTNGVFGPSEDGTDLRGSAVRSAGITVTAQVVLFVMQIASTMVLARLLTPDDFGVVTMVTTFSLLLLSFGQNGFNEAVLQRDDIDHFLASNMFWIDVALGFLLALLFAASGSLLARFYHDARVMNVVLAMSVAVFLGNTSVIHLALLKRAMHFAQVSINDIVARLLGILTSIALAWARFGYWALVAGAIVQPLATTIGAWILCRWTPGRPRRLASTGSVMRFVMNVYGRFSFNYFARNIDNLLIGWRFGPASLGFYKKAYDLFVLPVNQLFSPVQDVSLRTLSRVQHDPVQYRRYFLRGLSILAFVGMAVGADLTLIGGDVIRLLLGPAWTESGHIFKAFGPAIGIMMIYYSTGLLHLSIGRPDRWFKWVIVESSVTALLFVGALRFGPIGVAAAWTASFWLLVIPGFWYAGRPIGFGLGPVIAAVWKYVLAGLTAGYASLIITAHIPGLDSSSGPLAAMERIVGVSALMLILYLIAVIVLYRGFKPLVELAEFVPDLVSWAKFRRSRSLPTASENTAAV